MTKFICSQAKTKNNERNNMLIKPIEKFGGFKTTSFKTKTPAKSNNVDAKKVVLSFGVINALALASIGAAVAIKKRKVPFEISATFGEFKSVADTLESLAENIQKESSEIIYRAKTTLNELTEILADDTKTLPKEALIKIVNDADGNVIRKTAYLNSGVIMEEYDTCGKLLRRYTNNSKGISIVQENIETFSEGAISQRIGKELSYVNGKPTEFRENIETFRYGPYKTKVGKHFIFMGESLNGYYENEDTFSQGALTNKTAKFIGFFKGKLDYYQEGCEKYSDKTLNIKIAKKINYRDGKAVNYQEGYVEYNNNPLISTIKKYLDLKNNQAMYYCSGIKRFFDQTSQKVKEYILTKNGWQEIIGK